MPTPVEHLAVAGRILASPDLPQAIRSHLDADETVRSAYFFGHIAPDVQTISQQPREATHFFTIPPTGCHPAYVEMLAAHPRLARPQALPAAQAAFLVGYVSHLLLDERWVREVFYPIFGPEQTWENPSARLLLHNVLRAWLDQHAFLNLRSDIGDLLRQANPSDWLPFATDTNLRIWRDLVADQFRPGARMRTVEIFANRARISDTEFLALMKQEALEEQIFGRITLAELDRFRDRAFTHTQDLTVCFFRGCVGGESG